MKFFALWPRAVTGTASDADEAQLARTMRAATWVLALLHAHCEIDDPPPVVRDLTMGFGADGRPLDASVRLSVGDRYMGSTWFRFGARELEAPGHTALEGRFAQRVAIAEPIRLFGTHPISVDALLASIVDRRSSIASAARAGSRTRSCTCARSITAARPGRC